MGTRLYLYTDGAARGNPGPAAVGAALYRDDDGALVEVAAYGRAIGEQTNNVAEYQAVLSGLEMAVEFEPDALVVRADSELLVKQLNGLYKVRASGLVPLFREVRARLEAIADVRVEHVRREHNLRADELANQALDGEIDGRVA